MNIENTLPVAYLAIDCVIFGYSERKLQVLLTRRSSDPEKNKWALPEDFPGENETSDIAAIRILGQLVSATNVYMDRVKLFSSVERYPGARVVAMSYYALVDPAQCRLKQTAYAEEVSWFDIDNIPELPFDHREIFKEALLFLRRDILFKPIGFELLPEKITLSELQELYEAIMEEPLDKRNFRKKIKKLNILKELPEVKKVHHREARLYTFDRTSYERLSPEVRRSVCAVLCSGGRGRG